jgi:hypothetical protein
MNKPSTSGPALVAATLLLTITTSSAQAPPSLIPGSVSPVTFALSYTQAVPGVSKRDAAGKIVLDINRKPIPAFSNAWEIYDPVKKTLVGGNEGYYKSTKLKYSNRELLADLIRLGYIQGPVTGWSIVAVYVFSDIVDSAGESIESFYGGTKTKYYAVKAGVAFAIPFGLDGTVPQVPNDKWNYSFSYKNVSDPNPDPESESPDSENWITVKETYTSSFTYKEGCQGLLDFPETIPSSIPPWRSEVSVYGSESVPVTAYTKYNSLQFDGIQSTGFSFSLVGKSFTFNGQKSLVNLLYGAKVTNVLGTGPAEAVAYSYFNSDLEEEVEETQIYGSLLEGSITIGTAKAGNVAAYPDVLVYDEEGF